MDQSDVDPYNDDRDFEERLNLDIGEYPEGTDEILVTLLKVDESADGHEGSMLKRGSIALRTSLNKEQVRYRLEELEENDHVVCDTRRRNDQPVHFYGLLRSGKYAAEAIEECVDILDEVPEEVTTDHLLEVTKEIRDLREKI